MDWISKEFLLAICGSLLIALIAVSWSRPLIQGPPPQAAESPHRPSETNDNGQPFDYARFRPYVNSITGYCTSKRPNEQSEWRQKFVCESKVTDVIIAALTFFLMIFTGLLVWVGNRQERTTRQQMRAFVYLEGCSIINIASPINPLPSYRPTGAEILSRTEGPLAHLTIRNTGDTPALHVQHYGGIIIGPHPLVGELPQIDQNPKAASSAIPPGGGTTKMIKLPNPLTDEQIAGLRAATSAIWVYGEIRYRDAFRRKRVTQYRLFHNAMTGAIGVSTELTWAEGGNDAT